MEASSRCLQAKSLRSENEVFDGDSPNRPQCYSEGRLDDFSRYEGCILPYPYSSSVETIPEVHVQREVLPVQGSLFRPEYGASGLHKGLSPISQNRPSIRQAYNFVSRRLASTSKVSERDEGRQAVCFGPCEEIGTDNKFREVSSGTVSRDNLLRDGHQFSDFVGFTHTEAGRFYYLNHYRILKLRSATSKDVDETLGPHVIVREVRQRSEAQDEINSVCSSATVEQAFTVGQGVSEDSSRDPEGLKLVEQLSKAKSGNLSRAEEPAANVTIRRLSSRLGSNYRRQSVLRSMVSGGGVTPYKQSGIKGSVECLESGRGTCDKQEGGSLHGQQDSSFILGKTRGHKISRSFRVSQRDIRMGRAEKYRDDPSVCKRTEEFYGRLPKQKETNHSHRVDPEPSGVLPVMEVVGTAQCGSLCHQVEPQAPQLYVPPSGQSSCSNRRHVATLVQHGRLCLSSFRHDKAGIKQIQTVSKLQDDSGRAVVASTRVVSRSVGTTCRLSKNAASQTRPLVPTSGETVTSKPPHSSSSRLETVLRFTRTKRLSERVSNKIFNARRPSTNALYQYRWSIYYHWCRRHKLSAARPSINTVCEFLIYLKEERKMATDTIRGYRSMLQTVLRHLDYDISHNQDIADVIRSFDVQEPVVNKDQVFWNLDVVLKYLCSSKFEPIEQCSLLDLTRKTVFLICLALAKRVSEIQALSRLVGFSAQGAVVSLVLGFRAKNDNKCKALPRSFLVKDLSSLVGPEEEAKLCPVRALKEYIGRTKDLRTIYNKRLFISPRDNSRAASKNAIAFFIKSLVKEAHVVLRPEMLAILKVKSHEVRAVATSTAFAHNLSLQEIMETAQWRCSSVFASHYLKEVSIEYESCCTLGPFVAAGTVIT